jgi:ABC-2 type transport system ATP-binding protein
MTSVRRTRSQLLLRLLVAFLAVSVTGLVGLSAGAAPHSAAVAGAVPEARMGARSDHVRASHRHHDWKTVERVVPVRTGPHHQVAIDLDTTLYVPDNATPSRPQPAILMTHGFGLTKDSAEVVSTARFLAANGYVVLTYTSSGFGDSGGCITLQSATYDVEGARQLITKVLGPREDVLHDGKGVVVGTIGGSYGGGIQLPLAAHDQRVRTSVVGRTWNNLQYSLDPNNRVAPGDPTGFSHELNEQGVFKQQWTSLFYALGNTQPANGDGGCPEVKVASGDPEEIAEAPGCPGYYFALCRTYELLTSTGDADEAARKLLRPVAASTFIPRINVPVLLVQGQSDTLFNVNDATSTYEALRARGVPVGMIWNSGGHGGYSSQAGECEVYDGAERSVRRMNHCYLTLRSLRWMDHWLRGAEGGRGPGFAYYRDWIAYAGHGANDEQYGVARSFPRSGKTVFTLSGADSLVGPGATPTAGAPSFVNPAGGQPAAYSETSNFTGPDSDPRNDAPPEEVPGQFAAFTSQPFTHAVRSVGVPSARLRIANSNGQDMIFFAKVYDVPPSGDPILVHRLIAPVRVPAGAVGKPVRIKLAGFAHRFAAGHSVQLVLCSTDQTSYNAKTADVLTVTTGADLVADPAAHRPEPPLR